MMAIDPFQDRRRHPECPCRLPYRNSIIQVARVWRSVCGISTFSATAATTTT
jgi:hypothetical protein